MTSWLAAIFLVSGAAICLVASVGVLRLPDFFLRMHAATKAGVAGAGLVLIGVAFAESSFGMSVKVSLAIAFLLLTTPIAGHLLGRAGYVAGVPLSDGTSEDRLRRVLARGSFDRPLPASPDAGAAGDGQPEIRRVVLCLAAGSAIDAAIHHAVQLATAHRAELIGLALVDTGMLENVGPVPIGGSYYAAQLRNTRIRNARHVLADVVQRFEQAAVRAGAPCRVQVEEGDPVRILRERLRGDALLIVGSGAWFDQGVARRPLDPVDRLTRGGVGPILAVSRPVGTVRRVGFLHDGSAQSAHTWRWLLDLDPWPGAELQLAGERSASPEALAAARTLASEWGRRVEAPAERGAASDLANCEVVVIGSRSRAGWLRRGKPTSRTPANDAPLVVFA